jgi:hypothetical protein
MFSAVFVGHLQPKGRSQVETEKSFRLPYRIRKMAFPVIKIVQEIHVIDKILSSSILKR